MIQLFSNNNDKLLYQSGNEYAVSATGVRSKQIKNQYVQSTTVIFLDHNSITNKNYKNKETNLVLRVRGGGDRRSDSSLRVTGQHLLLAPTFPISSRQSRGSGKTANRFKTQKKQCTSALASCYAALTCSDKF